MPRVTFNRLSKKRSHTRKKRTSTLVKARYAPKTTRMNRSLIKSNAFAIRAVKRMMPPPIYTDYQYEGTLAPTLQGAPAVFFQLDVAPLMTPNVWDAVLRQDPNVEAASSTLVRRMQLNLRYTLGAANYCQFTTFVVSIRKDAADRTINNAGLSQGQDYVANKQDFNVRLNPSVFKVHYVRNVSLTSNAWLQAAATVSGSTFAGNPQTTMSKGQVNMKLGFRLRQPTGTRWRIMSQDQLAPNQRLYLLTFFSGQTEQVDDDPIRLDFDALYACYNSS